MAILNTKKRMEQVQKDDFVPFNEVYATAFKADFPARSAVEVARLPKDVKVEIEVIAYLD